MLLLQSRPTHVRQPLKGSRMHDHRLVVPLGGVAHTLLIVLFPDRLEAVLVIWRAVRLAAPVHTIFERAASGSERLGSGTQLIGGHVVRASGSRKLQDQHLCQTYLVLRAVVGSLGEISALALVQIQVLANAGRP